MCDALRFSVKFPSTRKVVENHIYKNLNSVDLLKRLSDSISSQHIQSTN